MSQHTLSPSSQERLVTRARAGEPVHDELILSLQSAITSMAIRHLRNHSYNCYHVEYTDLVQEANVAILTSLQRALTKQDPCAYLMRTAKKAMVRYYVNGHADVIKTYHAYQEPIAVLSLDAPINKETGQTFADLRGAVPQERQRRDSDAYASLYRAIEALPEKQRMVVRRCYELGLGDTPASLNEISRHFSPHSPRPANAHYHHRCALAKLRTLLASALPQYCVGGVQ
ncbi:sigma-70 family RNA polymerase sigma factor [Dictyobacter aurantiacus]|uniref:Uncharacterized protein n=1 Tax=Dictyobacter aurantiacus TaxID=1936993 RepID=A0A401ZGV6_9CHLR|nr:sigma-70 family RNA polymerase sigma factor [Dictyobacter aurantiacus]GCE06124.1 hypothetical protein KDAU_34530 [Dictyobacter aurantiacus]